MEGGTEYNSKRFGFKPFYMPRICTKSVCSE